MIAKRIFTINLAVILLILAVISVGAWLTITRIEDVTTSRLAYIHSLESVAQFMVEIEGDLALLKKIAASDEISQWFADENNLTKKLSAYEELMSSAEIVQSSEFYIGVLNSLNEYAVSSQTPLSNMNPYGAMSKNEEMDRWFFDVIESGRNYLLNVDIDKIEGRWRVWINHIVKHDTEIVGVISIPVKMDSVLNRMFGRFEENVISGYVIDSQGYIHMGTSIETHISEISDVPVHISSRDSYLGDFVKQYVDKNPHFFTEHSQPEFTRLSGGSFNYASVVPIENSQWLLITLFHSSAIFRSKDVLPFLFSLMILVVLHIVFTVFVTRKYVLEPLKDLMFSIERSKTHGSDVIEQFGRNRRDEFGRLSRVLSKTMNENELARSTIEHRGKLLYTVNKIAELLLTIEDEAAYRLAMGHSLKMIGMSFNFDCVNLVRCHIQPDTVELEEINKWFSPENKNADITIPKIVPLKLFKSFKTLFLGGRVVNGPIGKLLIEEQMYVDPKGTLKSIVIIPMMMGGRLWGMFCAGDSEEERVLGNEEMDIMRSIGTMFVSTFNRLTQKKLAKTDMLTGEFNRRHLEETIENEIEMLSLTQSPLSLISMDIDNFKKINDTFGHIIGDQVVRIFVARVRHELKKNTVLGRFGGDEFIVVLPNTDAESAYKIAERLRKAVSNSLFNVENKMEIAVTASFGVGSCIPGIRGEGQITFAEIVDRADQALYKAKENGRNCVSL